jgi:hypothetical protein
VRLGYSSVTPEVMSMPLAWVGPLETVLPKIAEIGYEGAAGLYVYQIDAELIGSPRASLHLTLFAFSS